MTQSVEHPSKVLRSLSIEDSRTVFVYLFYVARELIWHERHVENLCCFKERTFQRFHI